MSNQEFIANTLKIFVVILLVSFWKLENVDKFSVPIRTTAMTPHLSQPGCDLFVQRFIFFTLSTFFDYFASFVLHNISKLLISWSHHQFYQLPNFIRLLHCKTSSWLQGIKLMTVLLGLSFKTVKAICTFARHLCDFLKGASAEKYREVQSTSRILNEVSRK